MGRAGRGVCTDRSLIVCLLINRGRSRKWQGRGKCCGEIERSDLSDVKAEAVQADADDDDLAVVCWLAPYLFGLLCHSHTLDANQCRLRDTIGNDARWHKDAALHRERQKQYRARLVSSARTHLLDALVLDD